MSERKTNVKIGVFLPTFVDGDRTGEDIAQFARRAEELGFDSLWATDHLLHGSLFYAVPWLDPVVALTYAAAVTEQVDLGTSILVMPTRHPLLLAKEISTLQALCEDRYILGAGIGWDPREFEAVGTEKRYRGARTDEALDIVRKLLRGEEIAYDGDHFSFGELQIAPPTRKPQRVWVAGGRQVSDPNSPEQPEMARTVLERIGRADGWIARPTATPDQIQADVDEISSHLRGIGREPASLTFAHENFLHFVPTDDPEVARREQVEAFTRIMGTRRPFEYFEKVYLTGTKEQVAQKIEARLETGMDHVMFHTLEPSVEQLELWAEHLLPRIRNVG